MSARAGARPTPVTTIARGVVSGAVGALAMDVLWYARYKRGGGESRFPSWEFSSELSGWDDAPAPALVGRRPFEGLFQRQIPPHRAGLVNDVTHWAYGMLGGVGYAIVAGSLRKPGILDGLPFGATVWASSYVVLPAAKLYKPIWDYDYKTLAKDLSAHLVYGLATAATDQLL